MEITQADYDLIFMSEEYKSFVSKIIREYTELKNHDENHSLLSLINDVSDAGFCRTEKFIIKYSGEGRGTRSMLENYYIDIRVALIEESAKKDAVKKKAGRILQKL